MLDVESSAGAHDFDLRLPVVFGNPAGHGWHEGFTCSVSRTGVVIDGVPLDAISDEIVIAIFLPGVTGCLFGTGRVVAVLPLENLPGAVRITITVPFYRLERRATVMTRLQTLLQEC